MSTRSFDITSLLRFNPPKYICPKCYALLINNPYSWKTKQAKCPYCGIDFLLTEEYELSQIGKFLKDTGFFIEFDDLIGHSRTLAEIAQKMQRFLAYPNKEKLLDGYDTYPPMQALFQALLSAKKLIHFTTYGISYELLGAIKMASQQVPVNGIVSNVSPEMVSELTDYSNEAPRLDIKAFERGARSKSWEKTPHQKLIVVDGLLAFKGSANLTVSGWRKAVQGLEVIEALTDVKEVVDLHNRFFSPIWAKCSEFSDANQIPMDNWRVLYDPYKKTGITT